MGQFYPTVPSTRTLDIHSIRDLHSTFTETLHAGGRNSSHSGHHSSESMEDSNDTPMEQDTPMEIPVLEGGPYPNSGGREVCSSQKSKKEFKVWDHFTKMTNVKDRAKCNYCPKDYAYVPDHGTLTLWKHIKTQCTKSPLFKIGFVSERQQTTLVFKEVDDVKGGSKKRELVASKFDNDKCRKSLIRMIVKDELPFSMVEGEDFKEFCASNLPKFTISSRWTVARDCWKLYIEERARLKKIFKQGMNRVCLTTDAWTSIQNMSYMCLTAHFIDHNWRYQKRLISFCMLSDHRGDTIGKTIENCLLDWGIERVFTVTLDNASANDVAVNYVKKRLRNWKVELANDNCLHVRCAAHILNLIVNEGLKHLHNSIVCIRNAIIYIRSFPARLAKFKECAEKEKLLVTALVCLDVTTRWTSTFKMLESACKLQKAFERMEEDDEHYKIYFIENEKEGPPVQSDWENARVFVDVLRVFYDATLRLSGSLHVTSCGFVRDLGIVNAGIQKLCSCDDNFLRDMGFKMKTKFGKYWGNPKKINHYLLVAAILDPRTKLVFLTWAFKKLYGDDVAKEMTICLKSFLEVLYDEYKSVEGVGNDSLDNGDVTCHSSSSTLEVMENSYANFYKMFNMDMESQSDESSKSEMERYLAEERIRDFSDSFDVLRWWKMNSNKFQILSRIARDVLAIPVSTVASESAFSTGGRVLDQFRSSLDPKMAEALICTQDWLRATHLQIELDFEEFLNERGQWFEMEK